MAAEVKLKAGYKSPPVYETAKKAMRADNFRVIFMRKDPPIDELFWSALLSLRCYNKQQTLMH